MKVRESNDSLTSFNLSRMIVISSATSVCSMLNLLRPKHMILMLRGERGSRHVARSLHTTASKSLTSLRSLLRHWKPNTITEKLRSFSTTSELPGLSRRPRIIPSKSRTSGWSLSRKRKPNTTLPHSWLLNGL